MKQLISAIMSKTAASEFSDLLGGRIYLDKGDAEAAFPFCVFFIVSSVPDATFTEDYKNTIIQFSLFSTSSSVAEIADIYAALNSLFDECALTITGSTLVWIREMNLTTTTEETTTPEGTEIIKHWIVEFEVLTSLN